MNSSTKQFEIFLIRLLRWGDVTIKARQAYASGGLVTWDRSGADQHSNRSWQVSFEYSAARCDITACPDFVERSCY